MIVLTLYLRNLRLNKRRDDEREMMARYAMVDVTIIADNYIETFQVLPMEAKTTLASIGNCRVRPRPRPLDKCLLLWKNV